MRLVWSLLALSSTALDGCYLAHERETSCTEATTPITCTAWQASGPTMLVSDRSDPNGGVFLTSAVATPCGVVASWYTLTGSPFPDTVGFETRAFDRTGAPLGAPLAHPSLTATSSSSGLMELVADGDALTGLVFTTPGGCRLVRLAADGHELAPPIHVGDAYCREGQPVAGGLSYLGTGGSGGTPGVLVTLDAAGVMLASMPLAMPTGRAFWSRARLLDGGFLAYSFSEDPITLVYSGWLQHFDARGVALAAEVEVGVNGVPVLVAPTTAGALTVWETAASGGLPLQVRAVDPSGTPTSAIRDLPASGALYGATLTRTPDGNALVVWLESHFGEDPEWVMRAQVLAPDSTAVAPPTLLPATGSTSLPRIVFDPAGETALAFYDEEGVRAFPLACVR